MGTLLLSPRNAVDGIGAKIPNGVSFNDQSGNGSGPFNQVVTLIDASQGEILGQTGGTAITSDANGTIHDYLRGLVKLTAAGVPPLGAAIPSASSPVNLAPPVTGSYRMGLVSSTMAAGLGAASSVWQLRYGGANLALIRKVTFSIGDLAAFTAGPATFQLFVARGFNANGSGGTPATLTGNNGKLRTSYATNNLADLRISSTAALGNGTWTLDAMPIGSVTFGATATAGQQLLAPSPLFHRDAADETSLVLAQNEGLNMVATVPATGTWTFSVVVYWDEVVSY